jgi:hypothetical protein
MSFSHDMALACPFSEEFCGVKDILHQLTLYLPFQGNFDLSCTGSRLQHLMGSTTMRKRASGRRHLFACTKVYTTLVHDVNDMRAIFDHRLVQGRKRKVFWYWSLVHDLSRVLLTNYYHGRSCCENRFLPAEEKDDCEEANAVNRQAGMLWVTRKLICK